MLAQHNQFAWSQTMLGPSNTARRLSTIRCASHGHHLFSAKLNLHWLVPKDISQHCAFSAASAPTLAAQYSVPTTTILAVPCLWAFMKHAVILLQSPKVSQLDLFCSACSKLYSVKTMSRRYVPSAPIRSRISAAAFRSPCSAYALSRMLYVCSSGFRPSWCSLIRYCSS